MTIFPITSANNADTSDPVVIALRSLMKGEFLNRVAAANKDMPEWDGAHIVIYGSTLIRQLARNERVIFPLEGFKSSDIDIGVVELKARRPDFLECLERMAAPIIREAFAQTGFTLITIPDRLSGRICQTVEGKNAILAADASIFVGDSFAVQTFSPDEIHLRLKDRHDYEELKPYIPNKPMEVQLVISLNDKAFPVLRDPIDTPPESKQGVFKRTRTLDMLAGKIVRSMTDKYKPTDFIDIYNLANSMQDGKPFIDLNPNHEGNHVDALRVKIVAYMPMSRGVHVEKPDLLYAFENTPETRAKFIRDVRGQIAANKMPVLEAKVEDIFRTVAAVVATVMNKRSERSHGVLNLTDNERAFIDEIEGRTFKVVEVIPEKPAIEFLGRTFRSRKPAIVETKTAETVPAINLAHLDEDYRHVFKRFPDIRRNIANSGILQDKVLERRYGARPDAADIPLDF